MVKIDAWESSNRKVDPDLSRLILVYLSFKVGLILVGAFASQILAFNSPLAKANGWTPPPGIPSWFAGFSAWDASNYIEIANHGYGDQVLKWPFFPLYPMLIRIFKPVFFGNSLVSALVISNVCSIFVVVYLHRISRLFWSRESAFNSVLLFLAFPTAFFLTAAYTESLFLALTLSALYYFYKENIWAASVISAFVPLCRPQGLMFFVPLVVLGAQKMFVKSGGKRPSLSSIQWRFTWPAAAALIGTYFYLLYAKFEFGSPFAGLNAQKYYVANNSLGNLLHPASWFMQNFVNIHFKLNDYTQGIFDRIAFVFAVIVLIWIVKSQPLAIKIYAIIFILIPGMSGNLMSYTRVVLLAFPIFLMLGTQRWTKYLIPMMVGLQVLFFIMYFRFYWVA